MEFDAVLLAVGCRALAEEDQHLRLIGPPRLAQAGQMMPAAEIGAAELRAVLVDAAARRRRGVRAHHTSGLERTEQFEGEVLAADRTRSAGFGGWGHGITFKTLGRG